MDNIIDNILNELGLTHTELVSIKNNITYKTLLITLITTESIKEAAQNLNITDSALEHLIIRKLKPILTNKRSNESWDNYLLAIVSLKKCSQCKELKYINLFHSSSSKCKLCKNIYCTAVRHKYTLSNRLRSKKHYLNNKHEYILKSSKRRRLLYQALPSWANLEEIKLIYRNCPINYHVDHIIPLQGELVCGLHVENNLQYLLAEDNLKKSNKFLVD